MRPIRPIRPMIRTIRPCSCHCPGTTVNPPCWRMRMTIFLIWWYLHSHPYETIRLMRPWAMSMSWTTTDLQPALSAGEWGWVFSIVKMLVTSLLGHSLLFESDGATLLGIELSQPQAGPLKKVSHLRWFVDQQTPSLVFSILQSFYLNSLQMSRLDPANHEDNLNGEQDLQINRIWSTKPEEEKTWCKKSTNKHINQANK